MNEKLQRIVDRQEISDVLLRYCRAVDRLDEELFRTVFWPEGGFECPSGVLLKAGDGEFCTQVLEHTMRTLFSVTMHYVTNVQVRFEGDAVAHTETYLLAFHRLDLARGVAVRTLGEERARSIGADMGGDVDAFAGGRYVDRFEKRDGEWRIKSRRLVGEWSSTALASEWGQGNELALLLWTSSRSGADPSCQG